MPSSIARARPISSMRGLTSQTTTLLSAGPLATGCIRDSARRATSPVPPATSSMRWPGRGLSQATISSFHSDGCRRSSGRSSGRSAPRRCRTPRARAAPWSLPGLAGSRNLFRSPERPGRTYRLSHPCSSGTTIAANSLSRTPPRRIHDAGTPRSRNRPPRPRALHDRPPDRAGRTAPARSAPAVPARPCRAARTARASAR